MKLQTIRSCFDGWPTSRALQSKTILSSTKFGVFTKHDSREQCVPAVSIIVGITRTKRKTRSARVLTQFLDVIIDTQPFRRTVRVVQTRLFFIPTKIPHAYHNSRRRTLSSTRCVTRETVCALNVQRAYNTRNRVAFFNTPYTPDGMYRRTHDINAHVRCIRTRKKPRL